MRKWNRLSALVLTLALVLSLAVPAFAAQLRLTYQMNSGGNAATLTLQGLGEESVYGVQLELTLPGGVTASFSPDDGETYSPNCRVESSDKSTRVIVYLTAQKPLNEKGVLPLGTLTVSKSFTMPSSVTVTLLNRELEAISGANAAAVSTSLQQSAGSDDDDDEPDRYRVRVSSARHGVVKADVTQAAARAMVTLTVEPENRYALEKLKVTSSRGKEMSLTDVGGNRFTFTMPAADVEVTASFHWTGLEHIDMNFRDVVESDWYHESVHYVFESGMMKGTDENQFSPDMDTSRGMIVTILHRYEGAPGAGASSFRDVAPDAYYAVPVAWAAGSGVVNGVEPGLFGPEQLITREQMAAILYRYAQHKGMDVSRKADLSAYADAGQVSAYAGDAMAWAVGTGLIAGVDSRTLQPGGSATRAQVATILMRFCRLA